MEKLESPILPLYLAAPLSWYLQILKHDEIVLLNDVKFPKQTLRQKFSFASIEGPRVFSIPLVKNTRDLDYRSVEISYQEHWQNQLVHALRTSYGKSPFFEYYNYRFEKIFMEKHQYLWDLNIQLLEETLRCLKLDIKLSVYDSDKYLPDPPLIQPDKPYYQVFADKTGFIPNLSILDLIFHEGINVWNILGDANTR
jgi:hypothetical protein